MQTGVYLYMHSHYDISVLTLLLISFVTSRLWKYIFIDSNTPKKLTSFIEDQNCLSVNELERKNKKRARRQARASFYPISLRYLSPRSNKILYHKIWYYNYDKPLNEKCIPWSKNMKYVNDRHWVSNWIGVGVELM